MVDVSTAVKVDQRLQRDNALDILLGLGGRELFCGGVVAVDVGLVVILVVQLHDLAGDRRLECTVVICVSSTINRNIQALEAGETHMASQEAWLCPARSLCLLQRQLSLQLQL